MENSTVGLRLNQETQERLKILAKARDRSPHYLMKKAVEQYLVCEEAIEAEHELVQSRWNNFELTGETLDHSDIENWASGLNVADKSGKN